MLILKWNFARIRGWVDLLPATWFQELGLSELRDHRSISPDGETVTARCRVRVAEVTAELDYGNDAAAFNDEQLLYIGTTRLTFRDKGRAEVVRIEWRDKGAAEWELCDAHQVPSLASNNLPPYSSDLLVFGEVYSRRDLREMFSIADATLNTGVFRPAGSQSIWLFVTAAKTADRTQYIDELDGDQLRWEGQTAGRTDDMIITHESKLDELLVFHRASKRERAEGAFRYEGRFQYLDHETGTPSRFRLQRIEFAANVSGAGVDLEPFNPDNLKDGRIKVAATIVSRRGQGKFRSALMKAYQGRCAVTDCSVTELLEAAHIVPYLGEQTNVTSNGLLLRADVHTLFDLGLLTVSEEMKIVVAANLQASEYGAYAGRNLRLPTSRLDGPAVAALAYHRQTSQLKLA